MFIPFRPVDGTFHQQLFVIRVARMAATRPWPSESNACAKTAQRVA
jgi:hypothetical protein